MNKTKIAFLASRVASKFAASTYDLDYLLGDRGAVAQIGAEKGRHKLNGVSLFVSPHGSYRFVWSVDGEIVGAAQFMSRDGKRAVSTNTFVREDHRRQGIASKLLQAARRKFDDVDFSEDRSDAGEAWVRSVRASTKPREKTFYHGGDLEGDLEPLYLTPSRNLAKLHGTPHAFKISPSAKWLERESGDYDYGDMDSIGYDYRGVNRLINSGYDIYWDAEDYYRGYTQIFVMNPKVLKPVKTAAKKYPGPNVPKLEGVNDETEWGRFGELVFVGGHWPPPRQVWSPLGWKPRLNPGQPWSDGTLSFDLLGLLPKSKNVARVAKSQVLFHLDGTVENVHDDFHPHPDELEAATAYWTKHIKSLRKRLNKFKGEYYLRAGEWSGSSQVFLDDDDLESGLGYDRVTERRYESGVSVLRVTPRLEGGWYVHRPDPRNALYHTGGNYLKDFFKRFAKGRSLYLVTGKRVRHGGDFDFGADGEPVLEPGSIRKIRELNLKELYVSKDLPVHRMARKIATLFGHLRGPNK